MNEYLNEELLKAVTADRMDYEYIELLLDEGADPLGPLKSDKEETTIGYIFTCGNDSYHYKTETGSHHEKLSDRYPKIMSFLIEKGFDCSRFAPSYDDDKNFEMWCLAFSISKGSCEALKIMIENGLKASAIEDFICHFIMDAEMCDGSEVDRCYEHHLIWAFKMIMLCASYPHILNESEYLRKIIEMDTTNHGNDYNLDKFRDYNAYKYRFDYSTLDNIPHGVRNARVEVIEIDSNRVVWEMYI